MKKKLPIAFLALCFAALLLPFTASAAEGTPAASSGEGTATVTLVNQFDWGDGSGYQLLLDSTATAYGTLIPKAGPLARWSDSTEEVYSAFAYKIPVDAGWTRDTQAIVPFGSSQTIEIPAGTYDFCMTNPTPGDSIWIASPYVEPYSRADDFEFKAGMHYTFTAVADEDNESDGMTLTVTDISSPEIRGLEDGKSYCGSVSFTASDNDAVQRVTVNGTELQSADGVYTLTPDDGVQTVVASDAGGNTATVNVTVNAGHTWQWTTENGQYWGVCSVCGATSEKKSVPTLTITGADQVCRTQNYAFSLTAPEGSILVEAGYEFPQMGSGLPIAADGSAAVDASYYPAAEHSMVVSFHVTLSDGYVAQVQKTVEILDAHQGGAATCKEKAVCAVCGEPYGELAAHHHTDLKHIVAAAATRTGEGNTEYWYCSGCGKYYKDAEATQEITREQTVTAKLPDGGKSPQTGDRSNPALWITLLLTSGGAITAAAVAVGRKKSRSAK